MGVNGHWQMPLKRKFKLNNQTQARLINTFWMILLSFYILSPLSLPDHSVAKSCTTLCDTMDCSETGSSVLHLLLEFAQIHVHWVGDGREPSHSLPLPSLFTFNLSQHQFNSVQFSLSVMSDSLQPHTVQYAGFPLHHQLWEFTKTHVRRVGDAIQPSHPLSFPSPPTFNLFQHQGLF